MKSQQFLLCFLVLCAPVRAQEVSEATTSPYLDSQALVARATQELKTTGAAPVLRDGLLLRYPFGSIVPTLNCGPTSFCDLELEPGEVILGIAAADAAWVAERLVSGTGSGATPHVLLKPTLWAVAPTALLITTDRRTYHAQLTADQRLPVTSYVAFYYPRDIVRFEAEQEAARQVQAARTGEATIASLADLASLDCAYRIRGRGPAPSLVCDDGVRTYLVWKDRSHQAPAVFAVTENGSTILNHRVKGNWYILDAVAPRFELRAGRQTTTITRSR